MTLSRPHGAEPMDENNDLQDEDTASADERRLRVTIVTGDRTVYLGAADCIVLPGIFGQIAILRNHAPLLTALEPGEMIVKDGEEESDYAVSGGFAEVRDNQVIVLADAAERGEDVKVAHAESAKRRARLLVRGYRGRPEFAAADRALRYSCARLKSAQRARRRGEQPQ